MVWKENDYCNEVLLPLSTCNYLLIMLANLIKVDTFFYTIFDNILANIKGEHICNIECKDLWNLLWVKENSGSHSSSEANS